MVTEIPYQVNKANLIKQVAALINEKKLEGISDARDESDRDGVRVVFPLKRGEQAEVVLNNLYKNTQLQIGFGMIMLSIVNGQPRELGLVDMIRYFIDHRIDVVRRRTEYELRKAREREHILLGFQKALDNLDEVIRLIRAAKLPREAREALIARFVNLCEFANHIDAQRAHGNMYAMRRKRAGDAACFTHDGSYRVVIREAGNHCVASAGIGWSFRNLRSFGREFFSAAGCPVPDLDGMPGAQQASGHTTSHLAQTDHSNIHEHPPD